jgi:predicted NUDIX family phosphoesterase
MGLKARGRETPEQLLARAEAILRMARVSARRAFVLELTGTPKAGKTTALGSLRQFFKDAGYKVHLLKERASDCPLPMKGHFFFNAWTACTMLAEVLATVETNVDLLVLDRGFFDSLIWLDLQRQRGQLTESEKEVFESFVLLDRWRGLVDLTVIMRASPEVAIARENANLIVKRVGDRAGSLMNVGALAAFNEALERSRESHSNQFRFLEIDTSDSRSVVETNCTLLEQLLPIIEQWANPYVAVISRLSVEQAFRDAKFLEAEDARRTWKSLASNLQWRRRYDAEQDGDVVQMVACGIPLDGRSRVLVLERDRGDRKTRSYGRLTLWKGCHLERSRTQKGDGIEIAKDCLQARLEQDLHLQIPMNLRLLGMVYDSEADERHLGVMFWLPIDDEDVVRSMHEKEFRRSGRGSTLTGRFHSQEQILAELDSHLEPWSSHVISNLKVKP